MATKKSKKDEPQINAVTRAVPVSKARKSARPAKRARRKCCGG